MTPATAITTLTSAASAFERLRVKNFIHASPAVKRPSKGTDVTRRIQHLAAVIPRLRAHPSVQWKAALTTIFTLHTCTHMGI